MRFYGRIKTCLTRTVFENSVYGITCWPLTRCNFRFHSFLHDFYSNFSIDVTYENLVILRIKARVVLDQNKRDKIKKIPDRCRYNAKSTWITSIVFRGCTALYRDFNRARRIGFENVAVISKIVNARNANKSRY